MSNAYNVHMMLKNLNRDDFLKVAIIAGYKEKYNIRRHDFIINFIKGYFGVKDDSVRLDYKLNKFFIEKIENSLYVLIQYKNEKEINRSKAESLKNLIGKSKGDFKDDNISKEFCISVYGGTIRRINSGSSNGQIIRHLEIVKEDASYKEVINEISKLDVRFSNMLKNLECLSNVKSLQSLVSTANLLASGLNICVSVASLVIINKKLNSMNKKLDEIQIGVNKLLDNEKQKLVLRTRKEIAKATILIESFEQQGINNKPIERNDYVSLRECIANIKLDIEDLVKRNIENQISLNIEYIIALYMSYIQINKLYIKKINEIGIKFSEKEKEEVKKITNLIKDNILNEDIYRELYLCDEKIFTQKQIKETIENFNQLCECNFEFVDSQVLYLESKPA